MGTEEKVEMMYTDMYVGKGKENPSITTRLAIQEDRLESINKNLSKIIWLLVSTFLLVLGDIIAKVVMK